MKNERNFKVILLKGANVMMLCLKHKISFDYALDFSCRENKYIDVNSGKRALPRCNLCSDIKITPKIKLCAFCFIEVLSIYELSHFNIYIWSSAKHNICLLSPLDYVIDLSIWVKVLFFILFSMISTGLRWLSLDGVKGIGQQLESI